MVELREFKLNKVYEHNNTRAYEFKAIAKSETRKNKYYNVVVRIAVKANKPTIHSYMCECEAYIYGSMCKHVTTTYNRALKTLRAMRVI